MPFAPQPYVVAIEVQTHLVQMSFVSKIVGKSKSEHYVLKAEVRSVCKESVRGSSIILIAELEARYVAVGVLAESRH